MVQGLSSDQTVQGLDLYLEVQYPDFDPVVLDSSTNWTYRDPGLGLVQAVQGLAMSTWSWVLALSKQFVVPARPRFISPGFQSWSSGLEFWLEPRCPKFWPRLGSTRFRPQSTEQSQISALIGLSRVSIPTELSRVLAWPGGPWFWPWPSNHRYCPQPSGPRFQPQLGDPGF